MVPAPPSRSRGAAGTASRFPPGAAPGTVAGQSQSSGKGTWCWSPCCPASAGDDSAQAWRTQQGFDPGSRVARRPSSADRWGGAASAAGWGRANQVRCLLEPRLRRTHPSRDVVVLQDQVRAHLSLHSHSHGVQPVGGATNRVLSPGRAPRPSLCSLPSSGHTSQGGCPQFRFLWH